jgi:transcriptional regulator with XRE-family HTH domain
MSSRDLFYNENKKFSNSEEKIFSREELVYNVTESILVLLEDEEISKKELARRLGKSASYVTQMLSGARNMTLGSLSDICFSIGVKPIVKLELEEELNADNSCAEWEDIVNINPLKADELIIKYENVIDCREEPQWNVAECA